MKVYEDESKTELVAEIPGIRILSLLDWEHAEYSEGTGLYSIPISLEDSNEMFDILITATYAFGSDFNSISCDQIELCIDINNMECCFYINNGEDDGIWGHVELSKKELLTIMDKVYKRWRERVEHEYIVS